jgi:hypothetical protein
MDDHQFGYIRKLELLITGEMAYNGYMSVECLTNSQIFISTNIISL